MGNGLTSCGATDLMRNFMESNVETRLRIFDISEILPNMLYLSSRPVQPGQSTFMSEDLGIGTIINITASVAYPFDVTSFTIRHYNETDNSHTNLIQYFDDIIEFINSSVKSEAVLIHCEAGVSRSATMTLAFLMKHKSWKLRDAFRFLKGKRPMVQPNYGFMAQLMEWERKLFPEMAPELQSAFLAEYVLEMNKFLQTQNIKADQLTRALVKSKNDVTAALQLVVTNAC